VAYKAKFKARKPGRSTVRMEYLRPWEKNRRPAETFTLTIAVEK
jgi:predicted secreted protein